MYGKDTRRKDKFDRSKSHFKSGKNAPRTMKDKRTCNRNRGFIGTDRRALKQIAGETLQIIETGHINVTHEDGQTKTYNISRKIKRSKSRTITYDPGSLPLEFDDKYDTPCNISCIKSTTLAAARSLISSGSKIGILNFASAKNPGGGFLKGSSAQEESIARSSSLYECIRHSPMYHANIQNNNRCLYNHHMIYSPSVPVFRDDDNNLIEPYYVSVLSVPAVNTNQALIKGVDRQSIDRVMNERIDNLLSVASKHGIETLILGAWGCGVFGGDFNTISRQFMHFLKGKYSRSFKTVIFALLSDKDISCIEVS